MVPWGRTQYWYLPVTGGGESSLVTVSRIEVYYKEGIADVCGRPVAGAFGMMEDIIFVRHDISEGDTDLVQRAEVVGKAVPSFVDKLVELGV